MAQPALSLLGCQSRLRPCLRGTQALQVVVDQHMHMLHIGSKRTTNQHAWEGYDKLDQLYHHSCTVRAGTGCIPVCGVCLCPPPRHHWRSRCRCQTAIQALQVVLKMSIGLYAVVQCTGVK